MFKLITGFINNCSAKNMTFVCTVCFRGMDPAKERISVTVCGHMFHHQCIKHEKNCLKCNKPTTKLNCKQFIDIKDIDLLEDKLKFNGQSFKSRNIIGNVRKNFSADAEDCLIPLIQHISKQDGIVQQLKNCSATGFSFLVLCY